MRPYPSHTRFPEAAVELPHRRLGTAPTPVRELPGLPGVWVKDEGAYGDGGWGGNKVRKLEWMLPDVRRRGRSTILTFGALGTNHGLATARYGIAAGLRVAVAVVDQPLDDHVRDNLARSGGLWRDRPPHPHRPPHHARWRLGCSRAIGARTSCRPAAPRR